MTVRKRLRRRDVEEASLLVFTRRQEELRLVANHVWRPIRNFIGYEVSDRGAVRSYWKVTNKKRETVRTLMSTPVFLCKQKPPAGSRNYPTVRLYLDGKRGGVAKTVHSLVLETFVGPCPRGMECCHNDGDHLNCALFNLRWDTKKNNQADRKKHGTDRLCEQHPNAKLTWAKVRQIRERRYSVEYIAKKFGIREDTVYQILRGDTWKIAK